MLTKKLYAYKVSVQEKKPVDEEYDLPLHLYYDKVKKASEKKNITLWTQGSASENLTLITAISDAQIGKTEVRGDTADTMDRLAAALDLTKEAIEGVGAAEGILLDGGDMLENFNSVMSEMTNNDKSLMDQLDLGHSTLFDFADVVHRGHKTSKIAVAPSNHCAWRSGKNYLGTPNDDWGIHIERRVQRDFDKFIENHTMEFLYPETKWHKSISIPVQDIFVGLYHGDEVSSQANMEKWLAEQVHGAQPLAYADIAFHGHFHNYRVTTSGRSLITGRQKYIVGLPTLDNGSQYFTNSKGSATSDPGILFAVVERGKGLVDLNHVALV
jgi:hypothetical protein